MSSNNPEKSKLCWPSVSDTVKNVVKVLLFIVIFVGMIFLIDILGINLQQYVFPYINH